MPRLEPPAQGISVRMYRQGHGDCFLLCTAKEDGSPCYVVIDCGLWTGSECDPRVTMKEIVDDIAAATSGKVDVLVITHEHMDHVSGFNAPKGAADGERYWDAIAVDEVWLAWTEDPNDFDANALRTRFNDILLGLAAVAADPGAFGIDDETEGLSLIRDVLALHTGEHDHAALGHSVSEGLGPLAMHDDPFAAVAGMSNKVAMQRMREKARRVRFLSPGSETYRLPGVGNGVRVFALGPPRDPKKLLSLDPKGAEEFKFGLDGPARTLLGAFSGNAGNARAGNPFSPRYGVRPDRLVGPDAAFFKTHYSRSSNPTHPQAWRSVDAEWVDTAESLALRLNDEVNNTSLVLAFEMAHSGKVLLFTGDAQRGSWISWSDLEWGRDGAKVTARELLGRTVLYKVGHHGSHNATLNGKPGDATANLGWLGRGDYAGNFIALIPANKPWAEGKKPKPWRHPLEAIEEALVNKAAGRVIRMDQTSLPSRPAEMSAAAWSEFKRNAKITRLFAQVTITD